jgi:hypothetical protein
MGGPSHPLTTTGAFPRSPQTARTLAMLGACRAVLWVTLSVSGYLHVEPRVAQQQAGVALPMPAAGTSAR